MMDGNISWNCMCTGIIAEIRMCLNTQSEGSYKMRNAVLLKRGYLFNVAASDIVGEGCTASGICVQNAPGDELCPDICSR